MCGVWHVETTVARAFPPNRQQSSLLLRKKQSPPNPPFEEEAVTSEPSFLDASFWMLTLPIKYAPSSVEMCWAAMSPVTTADCFRSTARLNIAFQLALHDHGACTDGDSDTTIRPNSETVSFRVDNALHLAIYIKLFAAGQFPFNRNRLADDGCCRASSTRRFGRFHERNLPGKNIEEIGFYSQCRRLHRRRSAREFTIGVMLRELHLLRQSLERNIGGTDRVSSHSFGFVTAVPVH